MGAFIAVFKFIRNRDEKILSDIRWELFLAVAGRHADNRSVAVMYPIRFGPMTSSNKKSEKT